MTSTLKYNLVRLVDQLPAISWPLRAWYNLYFGEKELSFLRRVLRESSPRRAVGIDIGANTGVYSYVLSRHCILTFAFEPNSLLGQYWHQLKQKDLVHLPYAAGSSDKAIKLHTPVSPQGVPLHGLGTMLPDNIALNQDNLTEHAQQTKLDNLYSFLSLLNPEDVIMKVDVEGYELDVLEGSSEILNKFKPTLLIEIEKRHNRNYAKVFTDLSSYGYESYYLANSKLVNCDEHICAQQGDPADFNSYVNNFFFIDSSSNTRITQWLMDHV